MTENLAIKKAESEVISFIMLSHVKGNLLLDLAGYNEPDIINLINPSEYYLIAKRTDCRETLIQDKDGKEIAYGLAKALAENIQTFWNDKADHH